MVQKTFTSESINIYSVIYIHIHNITHKKTHFLPNMATLKTTKKHHRRLNNPFTSSPTSLNFIPGTLFFNSRTLQENQVYQIGDDFQLNWTSRDGGSLSVSHKSQHARLLWSTNPGQAFVSAAVAETEIVESRGSFLIKDKNVQLVCNHQTIDAISVVNQNDSELSDIDSMDQYLPSLEGGSVLLITGNILSVKKKKSVTSLNKINNVELVKNEPLASSRYWMLFHQKNGNQVGFSVRVGKPNKELPQRFSTRDYRGFSKRLSRSRRHKIGWSSLLPRRRQALAVSPIQEESVALKEVKFGDFSRICLTYSSERNEKFYGFGEQFSHVDFKGKRVPIFVQEQGIGRGDQPITFAANLVSYRAGGDWSTTYAPSPFYLTSRMKSLYLEGYNYSIFDLTKHDRVQIQSHGDSIDGRILFGNSPAEIIEHFTETIGRPPELPHWIISGAVVGMQGGTDVVRNVWNQLQTVEVPVSAFWLQDWVGQRKTVIGSQLWWNWEVDSERYWGWEKLLKDLSTHHIRVMTYCNPCLAPTDEKANTRRNLYEEAKELNILVKDKNGEPYMVPNTAFDVGMLDLTNPSTSPWFKQILKDMVDDGVRGWMADFGEGLPVDASLYSGEDPVSAHNRYPELWARINREFVEEWRSKRTGKEREDPEESLVFFMRAGFRDSPKWAMLFWEGDQMVSWQVNDGIKSAVVGLLNGGLSGYPLNHSDIGGYCSVNLPFFKYKRSEELLLRWMELNAFTTVFRTHEGNKPSSNSQFYSNNKTLSHFARFAKVYKAWMFYRIQLVKEASVKGLPVCRHLFIHYPNDELVQSLTYEQFLIGTEILVVPVLDKGKKIVKAYFPAGECSSWKHIWTGKLYSIPGSHEQIEAPLGFPAVFIKDGSTVGETFLKNLKHQHLL